MQANRPYHVQVTEGLEAAQERLLELVDDAGLAAGDERLVRVQGVLYLTCDVHPLGTLGLGSREILGQGWPRSTRS